MLYRSPQMSFFFQLTLSINSIVPILLSLLLSDPFCSQVHNLNSKPVVLIYSVSSSYPKDGRDSPWKRAEGERRGRRYPPGRPTLSSSLELEMHWPLPLSSGHLVGFVTDAEQQNVGCLWLLPLPASLQWNFPKPTTAGGIQAVTLAQWTVGAVRKHHCHFPGFETSPLFAGLRVGERE